MSVMLLQGPKYSPQKSRPLESGHRRHGVCIAIECSYKLDQKNEFKFLCELCTFSQIRSHICTSAQRLLYKLCCLTIYFLSFEDILVLPINIFLNQFSNRQSSCQMICWIDIRWYVSPLIWVRNMIESLQLYLRQMV